MRGWGRRGGQGGTDGRRLRGGNDRGGITQRRERVTAVFKRGRGGWWRPAGATVAQNELTGRRCRQAMCLP